MIRTLAGILIIPCVLQFHSAMADLTTEQKVLERFVGQWDGVDQNRNLKYDVNTSWSLNNQIIEQKQIFQDGAKSLILRGYDKQSEKYFLSAHDSRGVHLMLTGDWNEETKTFTFSGYSGETKVMVKSTFRNDDTEDWTITKIAGDGKVNELRGTNTRVSK